MIQANELRIGNYVYDNFDVTNPRVITKINIDDFISMSHGNKYYPIPITEEILLKCGFEVSTSADIYEKDVYSIQIENSRSLCFYNCEVTQMETGEKKTVSTWFFDYEWAHSVTNDGNSFWNRPKYLHQLQNLYFCLTGQELNVEL